VRKYSIDDEKYVDWSIYDYLTQSFLLTVVDLASVVFQV
jgi:hypothetical protein